MRSPKVNASISIGWNGNSMLEWIPMFLRSTSIISCRWSWRLKALTWNLKRYQYVYEILSQTYQNHQIVIFLYVSCSQLPCGNNEPFRFGEYPIPFSLMSSGASFSASFEVGYKTWDGVVWACSECSLMARPHQHLIMIGNNCYFSNGPKTILKHK